MFDIQTKFIANLKRILFENDQIISAILLGSYARKKAVENSDINIALLVNNNFTPTNFIKTFKNTSFLQIRYVLNVEREDKIIFYLNDLPKIELTIMFEIKELGTTYHLSEVKLEDIVDSILFDKSKKVFTHLKHITEIRIQNLNGNREKEIQILISKFIYEFERCSSHHHRCDSYQFYFYYNLALQVAVQLSHLSKGYFEFNFLPKNFSTDILPRNEQDHFFNLAGTLFLSIANIQKRKLLEFFYKSIRSLLMDEMRKTEIQEFCEFIYNRDILWNFRDLSLYNPKIKRGKLFRTSFIISSNVGSF